MCEVMSKRSRRRALMFRWMQRFCENLWKLGRSLVKWVQPGREVLLADWPNPQIKRHWKHRAGSSSSVFKIFKINRNFNSNCCGPFLSLLYLSPISSSSDEYCSYCVRLGYYPDCRYLHLSSVCSIAKKMDHMWSLGIDILDWGNKLDQIQAPSKNPWGILESRKPLIIARKVFINFLCSSVHHTYVWIWVPDAVWVQGIGGMGRNKL